MYINQKYLEYFDEYIQAHKKEQIGLYDLTKRAINYCQKKLNLSGRMPTNERNDKVD